MDNLLGLYIENGGLKSGVPFCTSAYINAVELPNRANSPMSKRL